MAESEINNMGQRCEAPVIQEVVRNEMILYNYEKAFVRHMDYLVYPDDFVKDAIYLFAGIQQGFPIFFTTYPYMRSDVLLVCLGEIFTMMRNIEQKFNYVDPDEEDLRTKCKDKC